MSALNERTDYHRVVDLETLLRDADMHLAVMQLVPADNDVKQELRSLRKRIAEALKEAI